MTNHEYQIIIAESTIEILKEKRENALTEGEWYIYNERIKKLEKFLKEVLKRA